jgi:hypothetical protein
MTVLSTFGLLVIIIFGLVIMHATNELITELIMNKLNKNKSESNNEI